MVKSSKKIEHYLLYAFVLIVVGYSFNFIVFATEFIVSKRVAPWNKVLYDLSAPYFTAPSIAKPAGVFNIYTVSGESETLVYTLTPSLEARNSTSGMYSESLRYRSDRQLMRFLQRQARQGKLESQEQVSAFKHLIKLYHPDSQYDSIKIEYSFHLKQENTLHEYYVAASPN
jgi:hypothetical protein